MSYGVAPVDGRVGYVTTKDTVVRVSFAFKSTLDAAIGGEGHSLCFQCGACVGDCPAAQYSERFNPRRIMLDTILGLADRLIAVDSVVWECTNCCNCFEHCPQDVRPVEVIMALKNLIHERGLAPEAVQSIVTAVEQSGRTVIITDLVGKRRRELGLPELTAPPVEELQKLLARNSK
jgi:heterodisulfide reductase subunit C